MLFYVFREFHSDIINTWKTDIPHYNSHEIFDIVSLP